MREMRVALVGAGLAVALACASPGRAQEKAYYVYVAAESQDEVALVGFAPGDGAWVEKVIPVGDWPLETEGPHGIGLAPDGAHWYLTLGHGVPVFGRLLKYRTGTDSLVGAVELGLFPATLAVSRAGLVFVVNANFHGPHQPSSVSVVDTETMLELARVATCTMPHGSRLSPDHTRHYSACMMDDQLVEMDALALEVTRRLDVGSDARRAGGAHPGTAVRREARDRVTCSPTWAAPSPDGRFVYVPCNRGDEVLEVDVEAWRITRRFASPRAPYNAEVTPDGRLLLVTQKGSAELSVWDRERGARVALVPSTRSVTHGVVVSPDGRYAFVSVEGVGGEPGAVDVVDLGTFEKVGSVDVGKQAGGIGFWKVGGR